MPKAIKRKKTQRTNSRRGKGVGKTLGKAALTAAALAAGGYATYHLGKQYVVNRAVNNFTPRRVWNATDPSLHIDMGRGWV